VDEPPASPERPCPRGAVGRLLRGAAPNWRPPKGCAHDPGLHRRGRAMLACSSCWCRSSVGEVRRCRGRAVRGLLSEAPPWRFAGCCPRRRPLSRSGRARRAPVAGGRAAGEGQGGDGASKDVANADGKDKERADRGDRATTLPTSPAWPSTREGAVVSISTLGRRRPPTTRSRACSTRTRAWPRRGWARASSSTRRATSSPTPRDRGATQVG
jgi:hypothetical protein